MAEVSEPIYPIIRTVGLDGILVTFAKTLTDAANRAAIAFRAAISEENWPEIDETACSLVSAYFRIDLVEHDADALVARLSERLAAREWLQAPFPSGRRLWTLPAVFGGARAPQLAEAADLAGLSEATAKDRLLNARLRVLTLGFAPGQPYLGQLDVEWDIPRQTALTHVPQGALVLAVRQMCLFTKASPTGWRHVGQTAFQTFRPTQEHPFPLRPGDEIAFQEVDETTLTKIEADNASGSGGATCEILP